MGMRWPSLTAPSPPRRGFMLQQQETYAQQLAALHELVKSQAILESQALAAAKGAAASGFHAPQNLHTAGLPMQHAAFHPAQANEYGRAMGAGFQDTRMGFANPLACPQQQPHLRSPLGANPLDEGGLDDMGDFSCMSAPLMNPPGGRLFTWHEEGGDGGGNNNMLQCRSYPSLRRNSWDFLAPEETEARTELVDGQPLCPTAASWDARQAFGSPPLRKRQALEPRNAAGQVNAEVHRLSSCAWSHARFITGASTACASTEGHRPLQLEPVLSSFLQSYS